jgi:ligand-binding sensor domain-containing protein
MNKSSFSLLLLFFLSACTGSSATGDKKCITPIVDFAYLANSKHTVTNTTQVLPSDPWDVEAMLPEMPSDANVFDMVSFARTKDGHNEIWVTRQLDFEAADAGRVPRVQFMVYQTDTGKWKLIPEQFDDRSAKSGKIYLASDGTIWAYLGFSGSSHFASYNDKKEQFEYLEGSENVPRGNLLLDNDGKFWIFASKDGVYSFDTLTHKIEKNISIPNLETSSSLYGSMATLAPDGSIFFLNMTGERQANLMHYLPKTDQLENVPNFDYYLGDISYNLFFDHSGRLWVGDLGWMEPDGTWYRTVRSPVFITNKAESAEKYTWSSPSIVLESSDNNLWFQSDNGMTWLDPQKEKWCWFTTERSNIVEDQQQNLWMIADGKLYKNSLNP